MIFFKFIVFDVLVAGVTACICCTYRTGQNSCGVSGDPLPAFPLTKAEAREGCAGALALAPLCGGADNIEALCLWSDVIIMSSVFDWSRIYGCDYAVAPPIVTGLYTNILRKPCACALVPFECR